MNSKISDKKIVLVCGTFDGIHEGHRYFISKAQKLGDDLIIGVSPDEYIRQNKKREPRNTMEKRMELLKKEFPCAQIIGSDKKLSTWEILERSQPNIIACGYDQIKFKEALEKVIKEKNLSIEVIMLPSFEPDTFHSSIIHKNEPLKQ